MTMRQKRGPQVTSSSLALFFVLLTAGGAYYWWFVNRPAFILYQLNSTLGKGSESAAIAQYERLLGRKNLSREEEIKVRTALGEFYWKAGYQDGTIFLSNSDEASYGVGRPFLDKAENAFRRVLELDPNNAPAHMYQGLMHLLQGTEAHAQQELELSHKLDPRSPWPCYYLSLINRDRGNLAAAKEFALQAISIRPDLSEARMALVRVYADLGEMERAIREFRRLPEAFKSRSPIQAHFALLLARQNYWEEASRQIEKALGVGDNDGWVRLCYGQILLEKGLFAEASGELAQAADLLPHSPWPALWLAQALALRGECAQSNRLVQRLNQALPRWPYSHLARGWSSICAGNDVQALSAFSHVSQGAPEFGDATFAQVQIYLDRGQFKEAGELLRPFLAKKTGLSQAYAYLSQSFFLQEKFVQAAETAESAVQENDRNERGYVWLGLSEIGRKNFAVAEESFRRALELTRDPFTLGYFAWFQAMAGDLPKAREYISEAINLHGESAELWWIKGKIFQMDDNLVEATQSFKRAVAIRPYFIWGHLGLVSVYAVRGSMDLAKDSLAKARRVNPQHKEVSEWAQKLRSI